MGISPESLSYSTSCIFSRSLRLIMWSCAIMPFLTSSIAAMSMIRKMKEKADLHLLVALSDLYEMEIFEFGQIVNIFKWTQIYDRIEEAIGRVEYLAYTIEGVVLKYA